MRVSLLFAKFKEKPMIRLISRRTSLSIRRTLRPYTPTLVHPATYTLPHQKPAHHHFNSTMAKRKHTELETPEYDPSKTFDKESRDYKPIVWVDCEMTGLDTFNDHIIEICCIITDGNLNIVDEGYESVIHYDQKTMDAMNEWCVQHHGDSGLTKKVVESTKTLKEVEDELLSYLEKFTVKGTAVLGGNTVHMDRAFMMREMPRALEHLHYRIIDVSSITEFGKRHNFDLVKKCPKKKEAHTARADILESIAQLKWYKENYFVQPESKQ